MCLLCSIHAALDASLGMSYILEMTGLHHFVFVFLQFIVAPSCRALCASVFFSSSECTYMHHLLLLTPLAYSVGLPFLLYVRHLSQFKKHWRTASRLWSPSAPPGRVFRTCFATPHFFHCSNTPAGLSYALLCHVVLSSWYPLETIIEQLWEFV